NRPDTALMHGIGGKRKIEALVDGAPARRFDGINLAAPGMGDRINAGQRNIDANAQAREWKLVAIDGRFGHEGGLDAGYQARIDPGARGHAGVGGSPETFGAKADLLR